jgi:hypothetical protein
MNVVDWLFKTFGNVWGLDKEPKREDAKKSKRGRVRMRPGRRPR